MIILKRIGFYLIGLSLGLVILSFIFKEKNTEFCYFPNCRVLKDLREKPLTFGPEVAQLLDNSVISREQIDSVLVDGDVNFDKSDTKTSPCKTYYIDGEINAKSVELMVKRCDNMAEVNKITITEGD